MKTATAKKLQLQRKANILRQLEAYSYQVAYFLLENETLAAEAVGQAFALLMRDDHFFDQPQPVQLRQTKQILMKQSLQIKISAMQTRTGV